MHNNYFNGQYWRYRWLTVLTFMAYSLLGQTQYDTTIYHLDLKRDAWIASSAVTMIGISTLLDYFDNDLTVDEIKKLHPTEVNKWDRSAIFRYNKKAAQTSNIFKTIGFFIPSLTMFSYRGQKEWMNIGVMYMETLAINASMTELTKNIFRRKRPFVYNPSLSPEERLSSEAKRSFYSGHVSHVAGMSFFTAKVFSDLYPKSSYKWLLWSGASILTGTTAYLRYEGGRHYPTDVIVGSIAGALVGYFIPVLHRTRDSSYSLSIAPIFGGLSLSTTISIVPVKKLTTVNDLALELY